MYCPRCHGDTKVIDSRSNGTTRRRRICIKCKHRFTTYETEKDNFQKSGRGKPLKYNKGQLLDLAKKSRSLDDMSIKLSVTRERVRQLLVVFEITDEALTIFRHNRKNFTKLPEPRII